MSPKRPSMTLRDEAGQIVRWTLDNSARRVPTFVQELTGLASKKQLLLRFGPYASFDRRRGPVEIYYEPERTKYRYHPKLGREDRWHKRRPK